VHVRIPRLLGETEAEDSSDDSGMFVRQRLTNYVALSGQHVLKMTGSRKIVSSEKHDKYFAITVRCLDYSFPWDWVTAYWFRRRSEEFSGYEGTCQ
jgi:hypothetical protein